jgi:hypothetical protein
MKNYESLTDALSDLKERGYEADFATTPDCLYCGDLDIRLNPEAFKVDEVYRFEGNADENSILYALTSDAGVKGTLVDVYGTFSESLNVDMVQKLHGHDSLHRQWLEQH